MWSRRARVTREVIFAAKQPPDANKAFTLFNQQKIVGIPCHTVVSGGTSSATLGDQLMTFDPESMERKAALALQQLSISPPSNLVVAVSGGLDSMVLLQLMLQLPVEARPQLTVAHLNHGLREEESDQDQQLVESICVKSHLPFDTKTIDQTLIADARKQTMEEAARIIRYQWLEETALKVGATAIATGHHADDQAETVLHHLTRGTGLRGLQGMLPDRQLPTGTRLLRPLLGFSRDQLKSYANQRQIKFREDSTNSDTQFTRNKIRRHLVSVADRENPDNCSQILTRLASSAADTVSLLDQISKDLAQTCVVTRTADHVLLRVAPLASLPRLIRCHFFTWLWIQQTWPRQKMTEKHWQSLAEATLKPAPLRYQLPGKVDVIRQSEWLRFVLQSSSQ